jgi:hypothetical protein
LWELVSIGRQIPPQRASGDLVGSWRSAKPKIHATGVERGEGSELLSNDQGGVIWQHDAARADPDAVRPCCDVGQGHGRRGAGNPRHVVVLGHPEAPIPERLGVPGKIERVV